MKPNKSKSPPLQSSDPSFLDLTSYLSSSKTTVRKIFKNPCIRNLINTHHPQVITFLRDHLHSLLELSFNILDKYSSIAFDFIEEGLTEITQALLDTNDFQQVSESYLQQKDTSSVIIYRISQITFQILNCSLSSFPTNCSFAFKLVDYIGQQTVLAFFERIFSDQKFYAAQNFFLQHDLLQDLVNSFAKWDEKKEVKYGDNDYECLHNSLIIFSIIFSHPRWSQQASSPRVLEKFLKKVKKCDPRIENERWNILDKVYTTKTAFLFRGLFVLAIEILSEPYTLIMPFHVSILNLLSKMVKYDYELIPLIQDSIIWQLFIRLLIQFPYQTFVSNSLISFFKEALKISELRQKCTLILEPVFMDFQLEYGSIDFEIGKAAMETARTDKEFARKISNIPGYSNWIKNEKKRSKIGDYGGKVPPQPMSAMGILTATDF